MSRRNWLHLVIVAFTGTALLAVAQPTAEELEQNRLRLQAIRKSPDRLAQLHKNLKSFTDSDKKKQDAIVQLDASLHKLPVTKLDKVVDALERYADWLEQLKKSDPSAYQAIKAAPDAATRLALIREQRDREWMNAQPKAHREQYAKLRPEARTKFIAELRVDERKKKQHWVIASRFWKELESKQNLPCRLADFSYKPTKGKDGKLKDKDGKPIVVQDVNPVKDYVEKYLFDQITPAEKKQLEDAEGQWPEFPIVLVSIASRYPSALPMPKLPQKFSDLPEPVQRRIDSKKGVPKAPKVKAEIESYKGVLFAGKFAEISARVPIIYGKLPEGNEFMACTTATLTPPMQKYFNEELLPAVKKHPPDEIKLSESAGHWPQFPQTIQELSAKYNLRPPWHILPDADRFHWDRYRLDRGRSTALEKTKDKEAS